MDVSAVVEALQAGGIALELSLRAKGELNDEHRALIREYRDDLLTLLASRHLSGRDYYLSICTSSGKRYVMAKPHHLEEAVRLYPWGVLSDSQGRLITSWGDVPTSALTGLGRLVPNIPEEVPA